ncbi:MAG: ABC transporter substrate-binding protein, partial [bacterium]
MVIPGLLLAAAALAGPLSVVGDAGAPVSLASAAKRVVSLSPGATEIVYALGAGARMVGTCSACDYPKAAAACPKVGDFSSISAEALLALKPDLVIVTAGAQRELAVRLRSLGVTSVVLAPASVDGGLYNVGLRGRLLGR